MQSWKALWSVEEASRDAKKDWKEEREMTAGRIWLAGTGNAG